MKVIPSVVLQYAGEAATVWLLRRSSLATTHYSLADLAKIDGRVEAPLDGLRVAGERGWRSARSKLAANEEGEVFAAGIVAFESAKSELIAKVFFRRGGRAKDCGRVGVRV